MSNALVPLLRSLRDIEGVLGSFVVNERGDLLVRDAPAAAGDEVLANVGARLRQFSDAFSFADIGAPFESTTLSFGEYKLHARALGKQFVIAVVSSEVNMPALRMAINMLSRRLQTEITAARAAAKAAHALSAESPASPAGPITRERSSQAPPAAAAEPDARTSQVDVPSEDPLQRSYRGRRFSG